MSGLCLMSAFWVLGGMLGVLQWSPLGKTGDSKNVQLKMYLDYNSQQTYQGGVGRHLYLLCPIFS